MCRWISICGLLMAAPLQAFGAEGTEIASAFDPGDRFDLYLSLDYTYEAKSAAIKREFSDPRLGSPSGPLPLVKDLLYQQSRHTLTPRLQLGVFHDTQLAVALPIVINDARAHSFDQSAGSCSFDGVNATCINRQNSTTLIDGILPSDGYDASHPTSNFGSSSKMIFRGVDRAGLDQLHLGLSWAPMNQEHDETKPTWILGFDLGLSIGKIMRFDRLNPGREDGVSSGAHEFRAFTTMARRLGWAEPFVTFFWQAPFAVRGTKPPAGASLGSGSQFWDVGFGQDSTWPRQVGGTSFGAEVTPWEDPRQKQKISVALRGRIEAHFEGRGYSEMWEPFAYAGDAARNPNGPLVLDRDPTSLEDASLSHPGVTDIENYLTIGGQLQVRGQVGDNARFGVGFELVHDQSHRISWTDAGDDRPACSGTRTTDCEPPDDDDVDPGTAEVNPLHVPLIDMVGRRYVVDDSTTYVLWVSGTVLF